MVAGAWWFFGAGPKPTRVTMVDLAKLDGSRVKCGNHSDIDAVELLLAFLGAVAGCFAHGYFSRQPEMIVRP